MKRMKCALSIAFLMLAAAVVVSAQGQVTAVRAGKMFDPKSGTNLANQVVLITGDKITDAGPADRVKIPAGAKVIDLSNATVLPGLIDGHVHLTDNTLPTNCFADRCSLPTGIFCRQKFEVKKIEIC